ncbi:MAG TPA: ECF-type sigma factor [Tahibacter sp.]|uniref:ECF-type sigma factor n=1 Tax=Tahibacter sp. TaxID=2056211 RepID=UPI002C7A19A1|nr:ECF-type sigma factor [Tahibacter sp.]HSX60010.1 ECF-type sigma factor [Tahibacter sp.]
MHDDVTALLAASSRGENAAQDRLFTLLYDELRQCARYQLRGNAGLTLSTTALVNETYVKLAAASQLNTSSRQHFMALAARAMRQVMVDHARRIQADKRGGGAVMVTLDERLPDDPSDAVEVLALDQALNTLEQIDERAARVVQLHFFGGLAFPEVAELEGLTVRTVMRDWQAARALLAAEMNAGTPPA